jgi:hypothetical protein
VLNIINLAVCCAQSSRYVVLYNIKLAVCCLQNSNYGVLNIINWAVFLHRALGTLC